MGIAEGAACLENDWPYPLNEHFIEAPLVTTTASCLLGWISTSFAHLGLGSLSHLSWQILSTSLRLDWKHQQTTVVRSFYRGSLWLWEPWSWSQIPYILKYLAVWFMNDWCFKFVLKDSQRPIPKPPQCCLVIVMVREVGLLQSETMLTLEQVFFNYVSVFDCIHSSFSSDQSSCPPLAWCCHQHYAIWFSVVWILVCKGEIVVFDF